MGMFAVKNDKGEWLSFDPSHESLWHTNNPTFFNDKSYAEAQNTGLDGSHVVELIEAPEKIVVSEEEADMLEKANDTTVWRPAAVISDYAYNYSKDSDQEALLEDRLIRAYVNGWTVEKPKRWNVKVPHTKFYYWKWKLNEPGVGSGEDDDVRGVEPYRFTLAEIEHYDLQDCEKREVKE